MRNDALHHLVSRTVVAVSHQKFCYTEMNPPSIGSVKSCQSVKHSTYLGMYLIFSPDIHISLSYSRCTFIPPKCSLQQGSQETN